MSKRNSPAGLAGNQNQILEHLFSSRVRVRTLKFLFRNYPVNFGLKELAKRVQETPEEVRKEIKILDKIGLIKKV